MKKFYNEPAIAVSFFNQEDVITTSGEVTYDSRDNAKAAANTYLNGKNAAAVIDFTF